MEIEVHPTLFFSLLVKKKVENKIGVLLCLAILRLFINLKMKQNDVLKKKGRKM
jgi:hypothetical protein